LSQASVSISTTEGRIVRTLETRIFGFDSLPAEPVAFEELNQVRVMREFLESPAAFLQDD